MPIIGSSLYSNNYTQLKKYSKNQNLDSSMQNSPNFIAFKQKRYNEIMSHEQAHKSAAGSLGGNIVIEKDKNGVAFAGHVPIKMPALDSTNPNKTIDHANTVIKAAMAPSDPSAQDFKVASAALSARFKAEQMLNKKNKV